MRKRQVVCDKCKIAVDEPTHYGPEPARPPKGWGVLHLAENVAPYDLCSGCLTVILAEPDYIRLDKIMRRPSPAMVLPETKEEA